MHLRFAFLAALLSGAATARADCTAHSAATRPHLVELYTSEGCSYCPPADRWLSGLPGGQDVVPLAFHVDYWDELGWRDRFAALRYTARQNAQARIDRSSTIYTPQVVLDGRGWTNWYRADTLPPAARSELSVRVGIELGEALRVTVDSSADATVDFSGYRTYVAIVESGLSSQVRAGENQGALLKHDRVVRAFAGPLPLAHAEVDVVFPADANPANSAVVVFAQNPDDGKVAQAVDLPLASCRLAENR